MLAGHHTLHGANDLSATLIEVMLSVREQMTRHGNHDVVSALLILRRLHSTVNATHELNQNGPFKNRQNPTVKLHDEYSVEVRKKATQQAEARNQPTLDTIAKTSTATAYVTFDTV